MSDSGVGVCPTSFVPYPTSILHPTHSSSNRRAKERTDLPPQHFPSFLPSFPTIINPIFVFARSSASLPRVSSYLNSVVHLSAMLLVFIVLRAIRFMAKRVLSSKMKYPGHGVAENVPLRRGAIAAAVGHHSCVPSSIVHSTLPEHALMR